MYDSYHSLDAINMGNLTASESKHTAPMLSDQCQVSERQLKPSARCGLAMHHKAAEQTQMHPIML